MEKLESMLRAYNDFKKNKNLDIIYSYPKSLFFKLGCKLKLEHFNPGPI
jgi:hypothetical protein